LENSKGHLETTHHSPPDYEENWDPVFYVLGSQGANPDDHDHLRTRKEQIDLEHLNACNETLLGWANMLDLRDHETLVHSEQVAFLSVELARHLEYPEEQLENIYRRALRASRPALPGAGLQAARVRD
jgi:HD-GYP domain-containing protein (c-di-GMP phosphodiesterase class II)